MLFNRLNGKSRFSNNHAVDTGGGIYIWDSNVQLENSILWGDTADYGGGEINM